MKCVIPESQHPQSRDHVILIGFWGPLKIAGGWGREGYACLLNTLRDFQKSCQNRISVLGVSLHSNHSKSLITVHHTKQNTQPTSEVELRLSGSFCHRMCPHFEFTWCFFRANVSVSCWQGQPWSSCVETSGEACCPLCAGLHPSSSPPTLVPGSLMVISQCHMMIYFYKLCKCSFLSCFSAGLGFFFFPHLSEVLPPAIINVKLARVVSVFPIPSQFMKWGFLECWAVPLSHLFIHPVFYCAISWDLTLSQGSPASQQSSNTGH